MSMIEGRTSNITYPIKKFLEIESPAITTRSPYANLGYVGCGVIQMYLILPIRVSLPAKRLIPIGPKKFEKAFTVENLMT